MKPIARWLLVSILLAFVAGSVFDDASKALEITYLANEGVLLTAGDEQVLIDGLHRPYYFEAFDLAEEAIDVAFIPYWYLLSGEGRSLVRDHIKPKHLIAVHIPPTGAEDAIRRIHSHFPEAVAFTHLLESKSYGD